MNQPPNAQVLFGILQTPAGMQVVSSLPPEKLLPLLNTAIEDVRMAVLQKRLAGGDPQIAVVPAGAIPQSALKTG